MKRYWGIPLLVLLFMAQSCVAQNQKPLTYVASTPCSQGSKPLPGMDTGFPCELMKWKLQLQQPAFTLTCTYGMAKQGSTGFINGGKTIALAGQYTIENGSRQDESFPVLHLTDNKTKKSFSMLMLSTDVLHLLDAGGNLMIGSAAWSFTLNRQP